MASGERFELDLDSAFDQPDTATPTSLSAPFVGDVLERKPTAPVPPTAPTQNTRDGFPEHKRQSRFKQRKLESHNNRSTAPSTFPTSSSNIDSSDHADPPPWETQERRRIDAENRERLASMSPEEIAEARRELMDSLAPSMLKRLLLKSDIDSGGAESDLSRVPEPLSSASSTRDAKPKASSGKSVSFAPEIQQEAYSPPQPSIFPPTDDAAPTSLSEAPALDALPTDSIHFPRPSQPPELDPSSPSFLTDLHTKYFPSLPSEPDKLEWMQTSNAPNPYTPTTSALKPSDIRFSFTGELLAPRTSASIPVTAGLHHHASAPDSAGYTIAELAHLSHSTFAPQRCVAFQTLGRILYRLGKGEFGDSGEAGEGTFGAEESMGELARGLWREIERADVIGSLVRESEGKGVDGGRHVSARAYATEAVWLWRKGGGRRWKAD